MGFSSLGTRFWAEGEVLFVPFQDGRIVGFPIQYFHNLEHLIADQIQQTSTQLADLMFQWDLLEEDDFDTVELFRLLLDSKEN